MRQSKITAGGGSAPRSGFTLVELLVTIALIGLLLGLLLPAVQSARESARACQCADNLKNIGLALANYQSARRTFPAGNDALAGTQQAWSSRLLPFIDDAPLAATINYAQAWNSPGANLAAANQTLPIFVCPSALVDYVGKTDYGGIQGTSLLPLAAGLGPSQAFGCGVLVVTNTLQPNPVTPAKITDGLSATLAVGESVDRQSSQGSLWACGLNCFAQTDPHVNVDDLGSLHSDHPAGAYGLFADGHVLLLTDQTDSALLGAICTRNGSETYVSELFTN